MNLEISKRARPSNAFGFQQAALGNLFLTGARLFTGSLESAICLLKAIAGIGAGVDVLPIVNTNHTVHIAATLADGSVVIGQNAISHPWAAPAPDDDADDPVALPGSLPALRRQNISYSTQTGEVPPLPTHVRKIWYVNPYGHEIHPAANPKALEAIRSARLVIYSIGSLYTSIVPCLIVKGVGQALMTTKSTAKVLMMNRAVDREISRGPHDEPMNYRQIVEALLQAAGAPVETLEDSAAVNPMVTHILYIRPRRPKEGSIALDRVPDGTPEKSLDAVFEWRYSVMVWGVAGRRDETGEWSYEPEALLQALEKIVEWQQKLEVESGEGEPGDLVV